MNLPARLDRLEHRAAPGAPLIIAVFYTDPGAPVDLNATPDYVITHPGGLQRPGPSWRPEQGQDPGCKVYQGIDPTEI